MLDEHKLENTTERFYGRRILKAEESLELAYPFLKYKVQLGFEYKDGVAQLLFKYGSPIPYKYKEQANIGCRKGKDIAYIGRIIELTHEGVELDIFKEPIFETMDQLKQRK